MALPSGLIPTGGVRLPSASDASGTVSSTQATTGATTVSQSLSAPLSSQTAPASSVSTSATSALSSSSSPSVSTTVTSSSLSDTTSSAVTTSNSATGGTTIANIGTQTLPSTQSLSASSTPSSSPALAAATSGTPFFRHTAAVAGVFTAVGVLSAILLIYLLTLVVRRRRQRALDREMDQATFVPASLRAIVDDVDADSARGHLPSLDLSSGSHGYSAASHGTYTQPPLGTQQYNNYGGGFPQQWSEFEGYDYGYAQSVHSDAGAAGVGTARSMSRQPSEPRIVQPQRARMYRTETHAGADAELAQKPSQSAIVFHDHDHDAHAVETSAPPPAKDYLSNYTSPPVEPEIPASDIPPLPTPHPGGELQEKRVLKVANE
ncbi:hypothetical protein MVEN_00703100 [Mycena venus]|uniref:Transmembrane protein n=1 Tax=Mycena venus TaxID=2733690 RepID=A0A8H6YJL3_9AGAR|nr:hypothetical protein MVEN_00703100 [Mycena venus]